VNIQVSPALVLNMHLASVASFPSFLVSPIEWGRIRAQASDVIASFLVFLLPCEAVPVIKPGEILFGWHGKIAYLGDQNAKLN
jgi:hypothetical protein